MATIAEIRALYPQYEDLSDEDLAEGIRLKSYADMPRDDFYRSIGMPAGDPNRGHPPPARGTAPEDVAAEKFQQFTRDLQAEIPQQGTTTQEPRPNPDALLQERLRPAEEQRGQPPGPAPLDARARMINDFIGAITGRNKPDPRLYRGPDETGAAPPPAPPPGVMGSRTPPPNPNAPVPALPGPGPAPAVDPAAVAEAISRATMPAPPRATPGQPPANPMPTPPQAPAAPMMAAQMISQAMAGGPAQRGPAGNLVMPEPGPVSGPPAAKPTSTPLPANDPFSDESIIETTKRRGQQFMAGAVDVPASVPEQLAIMGFGNPNEAALVATEEIARAQGVIAEANKRLADYQNMSPEDRSNVAAVVSEAERTIANYQPLADLAKGKEKPAADERALFKYGDVIRKASEGVFGKPDPRDTTFWSKLAQGGGNMVGFVATSIFTGPVGTAGVGASLNSSQVYKEARAAGATEEEAKTAAMYGGALGLTEAVPIQQALHVLPPALRRKVSSRFARILINAGASGGEEAAQEVVQQIGNNLIAAGNLPGTSAYDPNRGPFEGVGEAALIALILGGGVGAGGQIVSEAVNGGPAPRVFDEVAGIATPRDLAAPKVAAVVDMPERNEPVEEPPATPATAATVSRETPAAPPLPLTQDQRVDAPRVLTPEEQVPPRAAEEARPAPRPQPGPGITPPASQAAPIATDQPPANGTAPGTAVEPAPAGAIDPKEWDEIPGMEGDRETGRTYMENRRTGEVIPRPAFDQQLAAQQQSQKPAAEQEVKPEPAPAAPPPQVTVAAPEGGREITKAPPSTTPDAKAEPTNDELRAAVASRVDQAQWPDEASRQAAIGRGMQTAINQAAGAQGTAGVRWQDLTGAQKIAAMSRVAGGDLPGAGRGAAVTEKPAGGEITFDQAQARWDAMTPAQRVEFFKRANPRSTNNEIRRQFSNKSWGDLTDRVRAGVAQAMDRVDSADASEVTGQPDKPGQAQDVRERAQAAVPDGFRVLQVKEADGAFEALVEKQSDGTRQLGTGETPEAAALDAVGKLRGEAGGEFARPKVIVNRVGPDGKTDAERGGPYQKWESEVISRPNGTYQVNRRGDQSTILYTPPDQNRVAGQPETIATADTRTQDDILRIIDEHGRQSAAGKEEAPTRAPGPVQQGGKPPLTTASDTTDTAPPAADQAEMRPTYINRPVMNPEAIIAWARAQGFRTTLPADDLHVTITYSKEPVDRRKRAFAPQSGEITSMEGERSVEKFGDAVVLQFEDNALATRWQRARDAGASWDHDGYRPHVTITYQPGDVDLSKVQPYDGPIELGPESVEDINDDFRDEIEEVPTAAEKETAQREAGPSEAEAQTRAPSSNEPDTTAAETDGQPGTVAFGQDLAQRIEAGDGVPATSMGLMKLAAKSFGGTVAEGAFSPKDAYEGAELALNLTVQRRNRSGGEFDPTGDLAAAKEDVIGLNEILGLFPTQTRRDAETDAFQQFSTPPAYAYAVSWMANIKPGDRVLEPSAGNGGIAVFAQNAGAKVDVNELADRRVPSLKALGFDRVTSEDAEQIANIWSGDGSRRYDVVVMNPPFSAAGARGTANTSATGARHIEQALDLLRPGGRLVAIMGHTFQPGNKRVAPFFKALADDHTLQANVVVKGDQVYKKYGTAYDNRVLVIDKAPPAEGHSTLTGEVATIPELLDMMEGVRNVADDRRPTAERSGRDGEKQAGDAGREPARASRKPARGELEPAAQPDDLVGEGDRPGRDRGPDRADGNAGRSKVDGTKGARGQRPDGADAGPRPGRGGGKPAAATGRNALELKDAEERSVEDAGGGFARYRPGGVRIEGATEHPGILVESKAMASVQPPRPTYQPQGITKMLIAGQLSEAQAETVVYAGAAHSQMLPAMKADAAPRRKGYYIGDGTGVGKTREIAGIIADNWAQGRKKHVIISINNELLDGAKSDFKSLGMGSIPITPLASAAKAGADIAREKSGVLYATYATIGKSSPAGQKSRLDQIVDWLGSDFDGVIAFDEAHKAGNALPIKKGRGVSKPSQAALAVLELQDRLPNARIVYASATGATEVSNLAYADRLGLWGPGTPFPNALSFATQIDKGGIAAMEVVARDLKQMGLYTARGLSYEDVEYAKVEHELTADQRAMYDTAAEAWQVVLQNIDKVIDEHTNGGGNQRQLAMGQFWSSHLRFFNQVLTSMQMPTVLRSMEADLADGMAPVVQLTETNDAAAKYAISKMVEGDTLDDLDLTPRETLIRYLESSFPIHQYEDYMDGDTIKKRPVTDSKGNLVMSAAAVRERDGLIAKVSAMTLPGNPLDMIIERFGPDNVAEVTGRASRIVTKDGKKVSESRSKRKGVAEASEFQAGKRKVLVFSGAGNTGMNYHAGKDVKNQARRSHYVVQAGWRADEAIQGFGRTHRTNQVSAPIYRLAGTNLSGHKRFTSSIARRLDQLGALTKGQKDAGGGLFNATDDLENVYGEAAVLALFQEVYRGDVDGFTAAEMERELGLSVSSDGGFNMSKVPPVKRFLSRLLNASIDKQNLLFDRFMEHMNIAIETAIQNGEYTAGVEEVKHDGAVVADTKEAYRDQETGAHSEYRRVTITRRVVPVKFSDLAGAYKNITWKRHQDTGLVYGFRPASSRTNEDGQVVPTYHRHSVTDRSIIDSTDYRFKYEMVKTDEAEKAWAEQYEAAPKTREETLHMVTGALLPIWDRLPQSSPRIVRLKTDDGRSLLGREIPEVELVRALDNLGVDRPQIDMSAEDIQAAVLEGRTVLLSSGHRLERRKVGGEQRIEVIPPQSSAWQDTSPGGTLSRLGFSIERINYKARAFAPVGERGVKPITEFMRGKDVVNVTTMRDRRAAPMFYSPILRGIEAARQKSAPAQDWKAIIAKMPGVKRAEIDWLGVDEWLDTQTGQVTRDDLTAFVRDSQIEVVEDVLAGDEEMPDFEDMLEVYVDYDDASEPDWESETDAYLDEARDELEEQAEENGDDVSDKDVRDRAEEMARERFEATEFGAHVLDQNSGQLLAEGYWNNEDRVYLFPDLDIFYGNEDDVIGAVADRLRAKLVAEQEAAGIAGPTNHDDYTEPGGENYREILLRMPMLHKQGPANREMADVGTPRFPFVEPGHFGEENIVVHARVKDREGAKGEKILFVEEIQSDLASKWREGAEPEATTQRRQDLRAQLDEADRTLENLTRRATAVVDRHFMENRLAPRSTRAVKEFVLDLKMLDGEQVTSGASGMAKDALRERDGELYDDLVKAVNERARLGDELIALGSEKRMNPRTPDTPFKEEATYQLMVKRLLQMAADEGYDKVAWTPGYMQAERWDKAAQSVVEDLDWTHRTADGEAVVDVQLHMADNGGTIDLIANRETGDIIYAGRDIFDGKNLRDAVGPAVAARMLREPGGNLPGAKITFPHAGYAIAYDQQTRRAMDKFARKYGSRVVEDRTIPDFTMPPISSPRIGTEVRPVWSVEITPELRTAATEAQPILRRGASVPMFRSHARGSMVYQSLKAELAKVGLGDVELRFNPALGYHGQAETDFFGNMVLTIGKMVEADMTFGHEMIHFLRHLDLFTKDEWATLQEAANAEWMERYQIDARYPDLTMGQKLEEAIAEAFGEVYASKKAPFKMSAPVRAALRKVSNFIKAVRAWAKGRGFKTADDVFQAIMQGDFSARRAQRERAAGWEPQITRLRKQRRRPSPLQRTRGRFHIPDRYVWDTLLHTNGGIFRRLSETKGAIGDRWDSMRTSIQDRMLPILRAQQVVERELGRNLPESHQAYLAEEMYSGRAGAKLDKIDREFTSKIIGIMGNTKGMTVETVGQYLYARHAAERNARIAKINEDFPDGGSGMSNDEAKAILDGIASTPQAAAYEEIGDLIDTLREQSIDLRLEAGLMTEEEANAWRAAYQHYVPLKGWAETEGAEADLDVTGAGRGYNVRGPESMRALGRGSEAFNPLVAAITQAQEVVIRAEKNRVGQHLYRLARDVPAPGLWEVKQAETRRVFNEHTGLVEERNMSPITLMQSANEMAVKVDGKEHRIIFNDQRLANSAMNVGVDGMHALVLWMSKFSRYFSSINTMLNPVFVVKNFVRDSVTANINVHRYENAGKIQRGMMKDLPKAMAGAYRGLGKGEADTQWSRYFREYAEVGGKVSFWVMQNPETNSKRLEQRLRREAGGVAGAALAIITPNADMNPVLHAIERVNLAVDNAIRLSAYVHARKNGYTPQKAASLAKNLTVNFNRRGKYGSLINAFYTFSNAGFQGTQVLFKAMTHRKVQAITAGMVILAYLMDQANAYLSDEDDDGQLFYDKIPDYLHEMHFMVMLGGKDEARDAVSMWLPYGYNVFPLFGNLVSRIQRGTITTDEAIATMAHATVNAFMPISDNDLASTLSPTFVDPFFEIARNKNWLGWGIHPDPAFSNTGRYGDDSRPKSERYFSGASTAARLAAVKANQWTGGNYVESGWVDVYPDDIDHLTAYFLGGMGRTFGQSVDVFAKIANGEDVEPGDVPLVKDLYRQVLERDDRRLYFDRREEIAQAWKDAEIILERGDTVPPHILWRARLYDKMKELEKLRTGTSKITADPERAILGLNTVYVSAWKANTRYSGASIFDKITE